MSEMNLVAIEQTYQEIMHAIDASIEGKSEGHFAIKLTALISTDIMTRLNEAQAIFANDILDLDGRGSMDVNTLRSSLGEHGV
jgi:Ca2+-binding EF-hand superfamily protein